MVGKKIIYEIDLRKWEKKRKKAGTVRESWKCPALVDSNLDEARSKVQVVKYCPA